VHHSNSRYNNRVDSNRRRIKLVLLVLGSVKRRGENRNPLDLVRLEDNSSSSRSNNNSHRVDSLRVRLVGLEDNNNSLI
jgi:hypothetical protein